MSYNLEEITDFQERITELQSQTNYLTDQRNSLINAAYKNGSTIAELSRAAKVSRNTIYKIVGRKDQ